MLLPEGSAQQQASSNCFKLFSNTGNWHSTWSSPANDGMPMTHLGMAFNLEACFQTAFCDPDDDDASSEKILTMVRRQLELPFEISVELVLPPINHHRLCHQSVLFINKTYVPFKSWRFARFAVGSLHFFGKFLSLVGVLRSSIGSFSFCSITSCSLSEKRIWFESVQPDRLCNCMTHTVCFRFV